MPPKGSHRVPQPDSPLPGPPGPAVPPPPVSPLVARLRQDWRWAAISQFLCLFLGKLGGIDWDVEALETDLDTTEDQLLPNLMFALLYSLTLNTKINTTNWQEHLLRQYLKRSPETNQLGTLDEHRSWDELGLDSKIAAIHDLCEWQLSDPLRFRGLVNDGEYDNEVAWRIEPSGFDKEGNSYYIFQDHRIWRKRAPPIPPRSVIVPRAPKVKPPSSNSSYSDSKGKGKAPLVDKKLTKSGKPSHSKRTPPTDSLAPPPSTSTSALDEDLDPSSSARPNLKRAASSSSKRSEAGPSELLSSTPNKKARTSRRSRGEDDIWQEIPHEWLSPSKSDEEAQAGPSRRTSLKGTGLLSDEEDASDLSDLSESELSELSGNEDEDEEMEMDEEEPFDAPEAVDEPAEVVAQPSEDPKVELEEPKEEVVVEQKEEDLVAVSAVEEPNAQPKEESHVVQPNGTDMEVEPKVEPKVDSEASGLAVVAAEGGEKKNVQFVEAVDVEMVDAEPEPAAPEEPVEPKVEEPDEVQIAKNFVPPPGEWEAVCTSRWEWENYPLQWAGSEDPNEKALYELIVIEYLPLAQEFYMDIEHRAAILAAIQNRKRSSRLQTLEAEKAETDRSEAARTSMEARMEKVRKEESRKEREEAEKANKEKLKVEKLKEREDRLLQREETLREHREKEEAEKVEETKRREGRNRNRNGEIPPELLVEEEEEQPEASTTTKTNGKGKGKATTKPKKSPRSKKTSKDAGAVEKEEEVQEDWILSCEVCKVKGKNLQDDSPLLCCEKCNEWQHVLCHNKVDAAEGRPRRDWEKEDFKCSSCRKKETKKPTPKKKDQSKKVEQPKKIEQPKKMPAQKKAVVAPPPPAPSSNARRQSQPQPQPQPPPPPPPPSSRPQQQPSAKLASPPKAYPPPQQSHASLQQPPPPSHQYSSHPNGREPDRYYAPPPPGHQPQPHPGYQQPSHRRESYPPPPQHQSPPYPTSQMPPPREGPQPSSSRLPSQPQPGYASSYHPYGPGYAPPPLPPPHPSQQYRSPQPPNGHHSLPPISSLPLVPPPPLSQPHPQSYARPSSSQSSPQPPLNATRLPPIDHRRTSGEYYPPPPQQQQQQYYAPQHGGPPLPPIGSMNGQRRESSSSAGSSGSRGMMIGGGPTLPPLNFPPAPPNGVGQHLPSYRGGDGPGYPPLEQRRASSSSSSHQGQV